MASGASVGQATAAAEWFHHLGYTMPYGISMADFILDLASGDVYTKKLDGEASRKHLIACADKYLENHPGGYSANVGVRESDLGRELWTSAQVSSVIEFLQSPATLPLQLTQFCTANLVPDAN